ncbi:MAG: hypothetical protein DRO67_00435 [Candidatus Asgardarchaeum californiense]|nr:MAG: hypothetical protein DRO67_00435 [Candidatus Asgardarchaeum californiense]
MNEFDGKLKFRDWDEYDLHEDAKFDKYALDIDAENQAQLMEKWVTLLSQAQAELLKAKEVVLHQEAKLFLKVKTEGVPALGPKPTEATVKAWVHTQPEYRKAQRRKRKAQNNVQYLQNAKSVMENRKSMIKVEANLWITGYFARPHIKEDVKKELDESRRLQCANELKKSMIKRHRRQLEEK